jgi:hypothetical protein
LTEEPLTDAQQLVFVLVHFHKRQVSVRRIRARYVTSLQEAENGLETGVFLLGIEGALEQCLADERIGVFVVVLARTVSENGGHQAQCWALHGTVIALLVQLVQEFVRSAGLLVDDGVVAEVDGHEGAVQHFQRPRAQRVLVLQDDEGQHATDNVLGLLAQFAARHVQFDRRQTVQHTILLFRAQLDHRLREIFRDLRQSASKASEHRAYFQI